MGKSGRPPGLGIVMWIAAMVVLPAGAGLMPASGAALAAGTVGTARHANLPPCGTWSGPVGQAKPTYKPVIAHAIGASEADIYEAATHGITGFSIDSAYSDIEGVLQCSHAMRQLGLRFSSAILANLSSGYPAKRTLRDLTRMTRGVASSSDGRAPSTDPMSDESYLHIMLGGRSRAVVFIYYGSEESDDPRIIPLLDRLRRAKGARNVAYLVDPGPDCRVGTPKLSANQMLQHVDGFYIDDNCNANSQEVMSGDIHAWNRTHAKSQRKAWFATARADAGAYAQNWDVATATHPRGVAICSWNNGSYPDIQGNKGLLQITKVKSKVWRG